MTDNQSKLIAFSKHYEILKEQMKEARDNLDESVNAVAQEIGIGAFFQDADGTVYRVAKATGTYIAYKDLIYERTRRHPKERPGISLKEAREAGFEVE